jgi:predicted permease
MGWRRFLRRDYWDEERAREIEAHLAHEIDDNIARGMSVDEARAAAHRKIGNATRIREEIYDMNSLGVLETLWQDVRYGARLLRRNPTFALVAILTLALGTGANTAVFQLVDALRLRALPVANPDRLVEVNLDTHDKGRTGMFLSRRPFMTDVLWRRIGERQQAFSSMLAWGSMRWDLAAGGESRPVQGMWVSGDFFATLGVPAQVGRVFGASDDQPHCAAPGAVISDAFWHRQYGADPAIVGRQLTLNRRSVEIVGVTPRTFFGVEVGKSFEVALPLCAEPLFRSENSGIGRADVWFLDIIGRLRPDWTVERANAHVAALSATIFAETVPPQLTTQDADDYRAFTLTAKPAGTGVSSLRGEYATPLWVLLGVTGGVLLIACANLANLMLARATAREREIAVRLAIGASRPRVVRQMLAESLLIAALGAGLGMVLARWFGTTLVAFLSTTADPVSLTLETNWRVFSFAASLAVGACLLFGLAPAVRSTRASLSYTLKAGSRGTTDSRERFGLRRALVVVQIALSLVLVVGGLLLARTLRNLVTLDAGFRRDGVLIASVDMRGANIPPEARPAATAALLDRIGALPGVDAAAVAFVVPISGSVWNNRIVIDGRTQPGIVNLDSVGAEYFRVLDTPLLAGRFFSDADRPDSEPVAIINETLARTYYGGNPIGRSFHIEGRQGEPPPPEYRIVGVVKDTKYSDLREPFLPIAFVAASQDKSPGAAFDVVLRSARPFTTVTPALTQVVAAMNPSFLVRYQTMSGLVSASLTGERLMATLAGFFGGLALLIALIGMYGVMSYMIARRRMEIGIRVALGASRAAVVRLIVSEAGTLLLIGLAIGAVLAVIAANAAGAMLYGLSPWDPGTLTFAGLALAGVGLAASWLPARRALGLAPTIALREE